MTRLVLVATLATLLSSAGFCQSIDSLAWSEGFMDVHHINTARGNATFFVFPDGTTMLFDAGDKEIPAGKESEYFPVAPNDSLSAGAWIAHYIRQACPSTIIPKIDYAVISHFHHDHYGEIDSLSKKSLKLNYWLSGITEVGDLLPISTIIDRGYPNYDFPVPLSSIYNTNKTFDNYLQFLKEHRAKNRLKIEQLLAGKNDQIVLKNDPAAYSSFSVRNVKSNLSIWTGLKDSCVLYHPYKPVIEGNEIDENALGMVLKVSYGSFDYYTGGDVNGFENWGGFDMESAIARSVGQVEVMTLNHHGYYDASNTDFLKKLSPTIAIHQVIHDPHFQADVLTRLSQLAVNVFTYNIHETTKKKIAHLPGMYQSTKGHILVRVTPGGDRYFIYILDDRSARLKVLRRFGPYTTSK